MSSIFLQKAEKSFRQNKKNFLLFCQNSFLGIFYNIGISFYGGKVMQIHAENRGRTLYVILRGEIDEHNAASSRLAADGIADEGAGYIDRAVIDLGGVSFMDSTGIGFLIGRYKRFSKYGIPMYVTNLSSTNDKILQMSGVYSIIPKI